MKKPNEPTRRTLLKLLGLAPAAIALPAPSPPEPPEPPRDVLRLGRPEPVVTLLTRDAHYDFPVSYTSAIARRWAPGTGYCGRCPAEKCHVTDGVCLVTVPIYVADDDAADFSWRLDSEGHAVYP